LAERVARKMRLQDDAVFFERFGDDRIAADLASGDARTRSAAAREERVRKAGRILLDNLTVSPQRLSRLVEIEFSSPDPQFSAHVVNTWSSEFIGATLERRYEATSYARSFLEDRLQQLRKKLENSERDLVAYARQQGIINLSTTTSSEGTGNTTVERPLAAEDLAALNRELNDATADRVSAEARLGRSRTGAAMPEALQNQTIGTLRERRAETAADYAKLLTQFEPQYPAAVALKNQIDELDRAIGREEARVRNSIENTYQAAATRESDLRARVAESRSDLLDLRGRTIQYNIYQREVDTNRQLYDALLQRYKEIGVAGGVGINNISVVDQAEVPERPSSPNLILNVLVALLLGGGLGIALALAFDQIEDVVTNPADVESDLNVPLIGTVPKLTDDPLEELSDPKSALVEAYLSAQTRLAFSTEHGIPATLLITSTRPAEGKSTTSLALARTLARAGRSVLLIDADMRSPSMHKMLGIANDAGLSNLLTGSGAIAELVHRNADGGMDVLAAGPQPPNAAELLSSDRFPQLIAALAANYDHIILDAPPVMGLADAPLLARHIEGTIFVIESHATRTNAVRVAIGRLRSSGARVLGALLTKYQAKSAFYGYGYEYGYGYGQRKEAEKA